MDDEQIIGPLTLKQFLIAAGGGGLIYLSDRLLSPSMSIPLILITAYIAFVMFKRVTPPPLDEQYIKAKRYQFPDVAEYHAWLKRKIAQIDSQIAERARKGFVQDPMLDTTRGMLESALRESPK